MRVFAIKKGLISNDVVQRRARDPATKNGVEYVIFGAYMRHVVNRIFIGIISLLSVIFFSGCRTEEQKQISQTWQTEKELPHYSLTNVTHYHYEQDKLREKVVFERGNFFSSGNELHVENCSFVYYDRNSQKLSSGSSKRAVLYQNSSLLIAEDDVIVVSAVNGARLDTEYLEWIGSEDRFSTDRFVKITRENGDILTGIGMDADVALRFITIRKNVKGSIRSE